MKGYDDCDAAILEIERFDVGFKPLRLGFCRPYPFLGVVLVQPIHAAKVRKASYLGVQRRQHRLQLSLRRELTEEHLRHRFVVPIWVATRTVIEIDVRSNAFQRRWKKKRSQVCYPYCQMRPMRPMFDRKRAFLKP